LRCLSHVQSVVERRNTIPILSNVLIEAEGDGLKVMATDLDLQVVEHIDAGVESAGSITVSAHLLFDIARKLPEGSQVSLETADNRMAVKAGRSRFSLPTLPRDDFPVIVAPPVTYGFTHYNMGEIGTITRADGTLQVTLGGHPLYYFANDTAVGDLKGQGLNDKWYVAGPDGAGLGMTAGPAPADSGAPEKTPCAPADRSCY